MSLGVFVVAVAGAAIFLWQDVRVGGSHVATASCANHALQLVARLQAFADTQTPFPATIDSREAFRAIVGVEEASWVESSGSACPEAYSKDESIGYMSTSPRAWKTSAMAPSTARLFSFAPPPATRAPRSTLMAVATDSSFVAKAIAR